jgi:hypothetical protein
MANEMIEAVAKAWHDEFDRWIQRDARFLGLGFQVCRFDDSGNAGEFSEEHSYDTAELAESEFQRKRDNRSARAAIAAMRKPTEAMLRAGDLPAHEENTLEVWQEMIDAILSESS